MKDLDSYHHRIRVSSESKGIYSDIINKKEALRPSSSHLKYKENDKTQFISLKMQSNEHRHSSFYFAEMIPYCAKIPYHKKG